MVPYTLLWRETFQELGGMREILNTSLLDVMSVNHKDARQTMP
jgi:hypothetical protein